jgi:dTDP-4-dehydrorhamnose reductase
VKLFIVGANSPTGKALVEILRKRKIRFQAPADKHFDPDNEVAIAKMVTDYSPTQLINLADFISGYHSALKRAESFAQRCQQINALLPSKLAEICNHLNIPILHLSNPYVFDGEKKLGYNENDEPGPRVCTDVLRWRANPRCNGTTPTLSFVPAGYSVSTRKG